MLEGLSGDEVGQLNALMANLFLQPGEEEPRFRESVPWSHGDEEVVFFKKRRFVFKVDRVIEKSTFETVVSVQDRPQRAIKYAANCDSLDAMHPAARDHIGRMFFENIGVCSKTYFLSPAVKLRESMRGHFAVSPSQFSACVSDPRSHVRFLVYKRERSTINALVKGLSVPFAEAMRILESGIESLNAMHTEGSMAHGNINPETVVIIGEDGVTGFKSFQDVSLIDPAETVHPYAPSDEAVECFTRGPDSPQASFRDDVVRLLMVGAYMINGPVWLTECELLARRPLDMRAFKFASNFFLPPDLLDPLVELEAECKAAIIKQLETVLQLARGAGDIDYDGMQKALHKAGRLADPGSRTGCIIA